jgi:hypothetical protein
MKMNSSYIEIQRARVFGEQPEVNLVAPCKMGEGIIHFMQVQRDNLIKSFEKSAVKSTFFIPASGSGSRMFHFLFEFLERPNEENRGQVERFLNNVEDFAFFQKIPLEIREKLKSHDVNLDEFVDFLLNNQGMAFGDLPKGLIPFHKIGPFVLNPFQEQILQGIKVNEGNSAFHYSIKSAHEAAIRKGINSSEELTGGNYNVTFSVQNDETNAIAFDENQKPIQLDETKILTRPAGHGALLENLNAIESDIIFIKNIDNLQHFSKSNLAIETWKYLGGVAIWFEDEKNKVLQNPTIEGLITLNKHFQFIADSEIEKLKVGDIFKMLNKPFRVCGMVRNEGQPGGGPFWVEENGEITKQIVEKSQISLRGEQYRLMVQSSYFNPVMIAAVNKDMNGKPFDLFEFRDENKYFVVNKNFKGKDIYFSELPGLWNGSMAYWNSIFVEIPSETFSPVKTVLDLLDHSHKE